MNALSSSLRVGEIYSLTFARRPELGPVLVEIVGADQEPDPLACGSARVPVRVLHGSIPLHFPDRVLGPGQAAAIAPSDACWRRLRTPIAATRLGGGAA